MSADRDNSDGLLVVIVGPSGSGKDTLIRWLREQSDHHPTMRFVQRIITRAGEDAHEDSAGVNDAEFEVFEKRGALAVSWSAHGLRYGLPISSLHDVEAGYCVVVNGSRRALPSIASVFPALLVICIHVARDELARRLTARGRESAIEIEQRLKRADVAIPPGIDFVTVDNTGSVEAAGRDVLRAIQMRMDEDKSMSCAQSSN